MRLPFLLLLTFAFASCTPSAPPAPAGPALDEIQPAQFSAHLKFLSHDLLEGRAPSTRGGDVAAEYLAAQLALVGFEPGAADGTYFQQVAVVESVVDPSFTLRVGNGTPFKYLQDVVAFSGVQDAKVSTDGEVVFVGHGIVAPEYKWNDYEGVDIKGKIALVMVNDPPATTAEPQLFAGPALTYYGRWTYKFEEAARQGAAGAILIHTDESATYPWQVVQTSWSGTQYSLPAQPGQPALQLKSWVTNAAATEIAKRAGKDLEAMRTAARSRGAKPVPLGIRATSTIVQTVEQKRSPNVIGVLKGTDPARGLIYTAHYDHFGMRAPRPDDKPDADRIFNGAIDNASGLSGVLEIAQAFARAGTQAVALRVRALHDGGGIGVAGRRVLRGPTGAARGAVARQHQHRQLEHGRPHQGHRASGRRALDARQACRDDCGEPRARDRTGSGAGPRLLLPLRSLPARQDWHPRALAFGTHGVHRSGSRATPRRSATSTTTWTTTSRATSFGPRGTSRGPSKTCACWRNWGGRSPVRPRSPRITPANSLRVRGLPSLG